MKRVLFDSDVILDVLTQRQPHFPTSALALNAITRNQIEGLLAGHAVTNIFYPIADFEDAVTHEAAIAANVDIMVTRNIDDFRNATLLILLPEIFLETL